MALDGDTGYRKAEPKKEQEKRERLTPAAIRHRKFARELVKTGNGTQAYKKVYPESSSRSARANAARLIAKDSVKKDIAKLLNEAGVTRENLAKVLKEGLRAFETREVEVYSGNGKRQTLRKRFIDFSTRRQYMDTGWRLHGDLKQPGSSPDDPLNVKGFVMMLPPLKKEK